MNKKDDQVGDEKEVEHEPELAIKTGDDWREWLSRRNNIEQYRHEQTDAYNHY